MLTPASLTLAHSALAPLSQPAPEDEAEDQSNTAASLIQPPHRLSGEATVFLAAPADQDLEADEDEEEDDPDSVKRLMTFSSPRPSRRSQAARRP